MSDWSLPKNKKGEILPFKSPFWIISDTHFFHKNIVEYEPSRKVFENQNQHMLDMWKNCVEENDTIVHLGDIALGSKIWFEDLAPKLPGKKFLLKGNHDTRSNTWYQNLGFCIIPEFFMQKDKWKVWFSHYPDETKKFTQYPFSINIHGHVHSKTREDTRLLNVSAEVQDFKPQLFEVLIEQRIKTLVK